MEILIAISMSYTTNLHINDIDQISSTQELPTLQDMKKEEKLIHDFIQETSYMKWKTNIA